MATLRHMRQPDLFISLKRDLALVSFSACLTEGVFPFSFFFFNILPCCLHTGYPGGFLIEEWVKDARNEVRVETNLRAEANKALGASEEKNNELAVKLTAEERARKSVEASLKSA